MVSVMGVSVSDLVDRAREFATVCHASIGQRRKYTDEPYITHPEAVASCVSIVTDHDPTIAAAWLHDVVEDTPATLLDIRNQFGDEVASLVEMVTDVSRPSDGNRETRKRLDREHITNATPAAKTIKLADLIDNARSIVAHDPEFARVYLAEKELLLAVLREGDAMLHELATIVLRDGLESLRKS